MISRADILKSMQFSSIQPLDPINTTGAPREVVTYQFAGTSQPGDLPTATTFSGWTAFTAAEKTAFRAALDHIETFLNVTFTEVTGSADPDMNVGKVDLPGATAGYGGSSVAWSGTTITSYDSYVVYDNTISLASGQANLILHELGHAMGLKHPFEAPLLPDAYESNKFTVMSYTNNPDNGQLSDAMMLFDIFAMQDTWGAADYNTGDDTYSGSRTSTVDAVWDTGGIDTFSAAGRTASVVLDLREGRFSTFDATDDVVIAFGVKIENAVGGDGKDKLIGNGLANAIEGGKGNDKIKGGGGKDTIVGDGGRDRIDGGAGADKLTGGASKDTLIGGSGNDVLRGSRGDDKFVFAAGFDSDKIVDFRNDADTIQFNGLGSESEVMAAASQVGKDVVFDFGGGDVLTVLNITVEALTNDILV